MIISSAQQKSFLVIIGFKHFSHSFKKQLTHLASKDQMLYWINCVKQKESLYWQCKACKIMILQCTCLKLLSTIIQSTMSSCPSLKHATFKSLFASMDQRGQRAPILPPILVSFATYQLLAHAIQSSSSAFCMHWMNDWFHLRREGCWGLTCLCMLSFGTMLPSHSLNEWYAAHLGKMMQFLSAHSPFLTLIEEFFSAWRWKVYDNEPYDQIFLLEAMNAGCLAISAED